MSTPLPPEEHRFKSGADWKGNPGGRPKGSSVTGRLRDLLEKTEIKGQAIKDGKQVAHLVAEGMLKGVLKGDPRFVNILQDRLEGKVPERVIVNDVMDIEQERAELHSILAALLVEWPQAADAPQADRAVEPAGVRGDGLPRPVENGEASGSP